MEKNIFEINEITCIAYGKKNPQYLLLQPVNEPHSQMLDQQIRFMTEHTEKSFLLVSFLVKDWNQDLSPWCAPAVFRKEDFGKGAGETLAFIEKMLIPEIGRRYGLEENIKDIPVILGGYSLAGLFALWSAYQESCAVKFAAAAGMSPSVWFPGWLEYMKTKQIQTKRVYLSLGDREERTRNAAMRQVGQNIRQGQHTAVRAGFQRLLQRNGACFAPGVAQLHPQLVFNAAAGVTGKAGGAGAVIGIYCFNQADGADADKIILPAGNGIILFYNMCHQPQVVTDQRFARGGIPGAHGGEGGLFLLGGKRLRKAAGFQPEGQVEQMRSSRLQKKP